MVSLVDAFNFDNYGIISLVGAGGKTSLMFQLAKEFVAAGEAVLTTTTTKMMFPTETQSHAAFLANSPADVLSDSKSLLAQYGHVFAAKSRLSENPQKVTGFLPSEVYEFWLSKKFKWIVVEADGSARRPLKVPAEHEPVVPQDTRYVIGVLGLKALGQPLSENSVFRHNIWSQITGLSVGAPVSEASVARAITHERGIFKDSPERAKKIVFLNVADTSDAVPIARHIAQIVLSDKGWPGIDRVVIGRPLEKPSVLACIS